MGQNLFLMSHPDVSLVNILLSITRVSLVQNKCVFCQLRVHFNAHKKSFLKNFKIASDLMLPVLCFTIAIGLMV